MAIALVLFLFGADTHPAAAAGPPVAVPPPTLAQSHLGDVNGDGRVDLLDVAAAMRLAVSGGAPALDVLRRADVWPNPGNGPLGIGNGKIDANDARQILRYVLRLITAFQFAPPPPVSTLSGPPVRVDGTSWPMSAANSPFLGPWVVALDQTGNLIVPDFAGDVIYRVTPQGQVTKVAGSGLPGDRDGAAADSQFQSPIGAAADGRGNIYVADSANNCIRRISPQGQVATIAGSRAPGFVDGPGSIARFHDPEGLRVDAAGNVYVADTKNQAIRRIDPGGNVTTLAGGNGYESSAHARQGYRDGPASQALFHDPSDVELARDGDILVADSDNNVIRRISPDGWVSTIAGAPHLNVNGNSLGGYVNGPAATARFNTPFSIALDEAGNLFVADWNNECIRAVTPDGQVVTVAGPPPSPSLHLGYRNAPGSQAVFNCTMGVAVAPNGDLYVADVHNQAIRLIRKTW